MNRSKIFNCLVLYLFFFPLLGLAQENIYWSSLEGCSIYQGNIFTKEIKRILGEDYTLASSKIVAVDESSNIIYWTSEWFFLDSLVFYQTTPTATSVLFTSPATASEQVVDIKNNKIYWTALGLPLYEYNLLNQQNKIIIESNPDYWNSRFPITDEEEGKLYWVAIRTGIIKQSNLDGTEEKDIVKYRETDLPSSILLNPSRLNRPDKISSMILDKRSDKVYWTDTEKESIYRCNVDGTEQEAIVTNLSNPRGLVIDTSRNKIYWSDTGNNAIKKSNLDGTEAEVFLKINTPNNLYINPVNDGIYWVNTSQRAIQWTKLDKPDGRWETVTSLERTDRDMELAFDFIKKEIYWLEPYSDYLKKVNWDRTAPEAFYIGDHETARSLKLDKSNQVLYWINDSAFEGQFKKFDLVKKNIVNEPFFQGDAFQEILLLEADSSLITFERGRIQKKSADGKNEQILFHNPFISLSQLTINQQNGKLFWRNELSHFIQSMGVVEKKIEDVVYQSKYSSNFEIDTFNQKLYWAVNDNLELIKRINLDGTEEEVLVRGGLGLVDLLRLNIPKNYMYWVDRDRNKIQRASLDGIGKKDIRINLETVYDFKINPYNDELNWATSQGLFKSNINGGATKMLYEGFVSQIHITEQLGTIWSNFRKIRASYWDGTNQKIILANQIERPSDVTIDYHNNKLYWSEIIGGKIKRANLGGTEIENILDDPKGEIRSHRIAIDAINQKIYLANFVRGKIQRMNMDGSQIETIHSNVSKPAEIVLDLENQMMYWTEYEGEALKKSDLNGFTTEILANTSEAISLALDKSNQRIYWTEQEGLIRSANLDGTDVRTILANVFNPYSLAIDEEQQLLYWVESRFSVGDYWLEPIEFPGDKIYRANLDGTDKTLLFDNLFDVYDLAIGPTSFSTSIKQISLNELLKVSPNPVKDILTIELTNISFKNGNWSLFDLTGKKVLGGLLQPSTLTVKLDLSTVLAGAYLLNITTEEGSFSSKIIKSN